MADVESLTDRERLILGVVIETYIATAEPAGSQTVARRSGLGISSASIRSTMSDLEAKGYLYHPHTSAGRIPTDRAYRVYVDAMIRRTPPDSQAREHLEAELLSTTPTDQLLARAAQVLGILTQELGIAVAPAFEEIILDRIDLAPTASDRLLLVFNLRSGAIRTIFVRLSVELAPTQVAEAQRILNERLGGLPLRTIRATYAERLRDAGSAESGDLLDIIIAEGDEVFGSMQPPEPVMLGSTALLIEQPEFASTEQMRSLVSLTDRRDVLREALAQRRQEGLTVTIGAEHGEAGLAGFTLVTSTYHRGGATGVIGVLGPTRMPYEKILGLVEHTGRLMADLTQ